MRKRTGLRRNFFGEFNKCRRCYGVPSQKKWNTGVYRKSNRANIKISGGKQVKTVVNSSLVYVEKDGKYLMLHRVKKQNDLNKDKWLGVGGKFEFGESPEQCALREACEETGLTLESIRYRGIVTFVYGDITEYMHLFTSDVFSGELKDCDEGTLEWIDKSLVKNLPVWEGDKLFFELLEREDVPFFSLKLVYEGDKLVHSETKIY
ncbi:MAG: 8-oxo-dGTP diphosphatase [Clostridia bacterium]|nr:8-oxo-dGTP diphosphatase [Clostridia bacterium]